MQCEAIWVKVTSEVHSQHRTDAFMHTEKKEFYISGYNVDRAYFVQQNNLTRTIQLCGWWLELMYRHKSISQQDKLHNGRSPGTT